MKNISFLFLLVSSLGLMSCANFGTASRTIRFQENVSVRYPDGREATFKSGESLNLARDPVVVEAPGYVGVLIVPMVGDGGVSDLKLREVSKWGGPGMDKALDERLNQVMLRVIEAQRALSRRSGREALAIVEDLQAKNPGLTYLNFLKASSYLLLGDREGARRAVEAGLESFPDDRAGRELLRSLGSTR